MTVTWSFREEKLRYTYQHEESRNTGIVVGDAREGNYLHNKTEVHQQQRQRRGGGREGGGDGGGDDPLDVDGGEGGSFELLP